MAKVLIVDDDPTFREFASKALKERGHQVAATCDGVEALERSESETFDLVLSDWEMPRMSGRELCERLKVRGSTADIPVILIGAKQNGSPLLDHWETDAYDAGAVDYLTKPLRVADLQASTSKALLHQ
jgi:two-component system phosphate regulon response regulator PhoB